MVWGTITYSGLIDPFFLPTPSAITQTLWRLFTEHALLADIWISVFRVMVAFFLSAILAIPIGILMSAFHPLAAVLEPHIDFVRYLPVPALVPLMILWVGIGETSKILLLFIGTFFQLVLLVMDDANNIRKEYFDLASTLGAPPEALVTRVLFPAILPAVYDDLRVTLGWCWTYLLIAEIVAAKTGIGHLIQEAQRFARPEIVISGVIVIGLIGIVTDLLFKLGGKLFFRYLHDG